MHCYSFFLRILSLIFCFLLMPLAHTASATSYLPLPDAPMTKAKAAILLDQRTGTVLAQSNADQRLYPASLTKIMTSYVIGQALKAGTLHLEELVTISPNAWSKNFPGASKMFIEVGKQVSVADLHKGIIISSGNDACVAMAEYIAGSEANFVKLMNRYAAELQLSNTHFINAHGAHHPDQYASAHDIAILSATLIRDLPDDYALYKEKSFTYNGIIQSNRNGLLWDPSLKIDGIKTGYNDPAGYSLAASATDDQTRLIAVVMGAASFRAREMEARQLLHWGLRFFETVQVLKPDQQVALEHVWFGKQRQVSLGVKQSVFLSLARGRSSEIRCNHRLDHPLKAPLQAGQTVGHVYFLLDGQQVAEQPLQVLQAIQPGSFWIRCLDHLRLWLRRTPHADSTHA